MNRRHLALVSAAVVLVLVAWFLLLWSPKGAQLADVLVHPGDLETDCHVLREAAASGVPVVAARAGGAPDVVRHLETGLLYDTDARDGLRRAVEAVVADPRRTLLGAHARELATGRSWADAVDELVLEHYPAPTPLAA